MSTHHAAPEETTLHATAITPEVQQTARAIAEWLYPGRVEEMLANQDYLLTVAAAVNAGFLRAREQFNDAVAGIIVNGQREAGWQYGRRRG